MRKYFFIVFLILVFQACAQKNKEQKQTLQHYSLFNGQEISMPKQLKEISGITFGNNDSLLYAEQDELGNVYSIQLKTKKVQLNYSLGIKGDFEDIAYAKGLFFLLRSDGKIFSFSEKNKTLLQIQDAKIYEKIVPNAEYEGLCYHTQTNSLYLLAKTIPNDKKYCLIYQLQLNDKYEIVATKELQLNIKDWNSLLNQKISHFRPSAISYNYLDKQWFILSSINHVLIVLDSKWNIVDYAVLDIQKYPQPEGMTFDRSGNLWIASEAGTQKNGKIYKIERK